MRKALLFAAVICLLPTVLLVAGEKLAFISGIDKVPNVYFCNPADLKIEPVTTYELDGVLGYDLTPEGRRLVAAILNPVSDKFLGIRLVVKDYPYQDENIIMTYAIKNLDAVRQMYHLAIDPRGNSVVCVDTFGTMLVDLNQKQSKYLFTHRNRVGFGICESYYNWGGEFSPDGNSICVQSFCISNQMRFDVYNQTTRDYRYVYELPNITGFSWMSKSDGLLLSANSCGESAGLYIADISPSKPLINLTVCNPGMAACNRYFKEYYSEFYCPQAFENDNKILVFAHGFKSDGTELKDVVIIDQEKQLLTEVMSGDFIELKLSPSGRYLAGIANPCSRDRQGTIYLYDFESNLGSYIAQNDSTCSQICWISSQ